MTQDAYIHTCLHESAHAIVAMALGFRVDRIAVDCRDGITYGEVSILDMRDDAPSVAVLLSGLIGTNLFSHRVHNWIDVIPPTMPVARTTVAKRRIAISDETLSCDPYCYDAPGRDAFRIGEILRDRPDANWIFELAHRLACAALDSNCTALAELCRRLSSAGELRGAHLSDLLAGITTYNTEVKR